MVMGYVEVGNTSVRASLAYGLSKQVETVRFPQKGVRLPSLPPTRDPACRTQTAELSVHGGLTAALLVFARMVRLVLGVFSEYTQVQRVLRKKVPLPTFVLRAPGRGLCLYL